MSWSNWQKYAPTPPPGPVWSAVDPAVQVCVEIRNAPDACATDALKNVFKYLSPGLSSPMLQPVSCVDRRYTRQIYDPELLQGTYAYQTQPITGPCYVENPIVISHFMP